MQPPEPAAARCPDSRFNVTKWILQQSQSRFPFYAYGDILTLFQISQINITFYLHTGSGSTNAREGVQCRGEIIFLEVAGEKRLPSSSLCSVEVSVALTTALHAHQAGRMTPHSSASPEHKHTPTHRTQKPHGAYCQKCYRSRSP